MTDDPDSEVHRWKWVDVSNGLPKEISTAMHVPIKDNILMSRLGLAGKEDSMKDCGPMLKKYMTKNKDKFGDPEMVVLDNEDPITDADYSPGAMAAEDKDPIKGKKGPVKRKAGE